MLHQEDYTASTKSERIALHNMKMFEEINEKLSKLIDILSTPSVGAIDTPVEVNEEIPIDEVKKPKRKSKKAEV